MEDPHYTASEPEMEVMSDNGERHFYADGRTDLPFMVHSELDDIGLDPYEFRVYAHIIRRAGPHPGGRFWESVDNAAAHCRMDVKTYRRSLASLVNMRILHAEERSGSTTVYTPTPRSKWLRRDSNIVRPLPHMVPLPDLVPEGNPSITSSPKEEVDTGTSVTTSRRTASSEHAKSEKIIDAWNSNRGVLPQVTTLSSSRHTKVVAFAKQCHRSGIDPVEVMTFAAQRVAKNDWWVQNKYGLDNLMAGGKVFREYEAAMVEVKVLPSVADFPVGSWVWWVMNPNLPHGKRLYGMVIEHLSEVDSVIVRLANPSEDSFVEDTLWYWTSQVRREGVRRLNAMDKPPVNIREPWKLAGDDEE